MHKSKSSSISTSSSTSISLQQMDNKLSDALNKVDLIFSAFALKFGKVKEHGVPVSPNLHPHITEDDTGKLRGKAAEGENSITGDSFGDTDTKKSKKSTKSKPIPLEYKYKCEFCDKICAHPKNLRAHRKKHTNPTVHPCDICKQVFKSPAKLAMHRRTHTGEKPFKCNLCPKAFHRKDMLTVHKLTHLQENEKQFVCEFCGKRFSRESGLSEHRSTHTISHEEKSIICEICGKCVGRRKLKNHQLLHVGVRLFRCTVAGCEKTYTNQSQLNQHVKIMHSNEKRFKCNYCEKYFKREFARKIHHRVHTKERPYSCEICGNAFSESGALNRHIRNVHKEQN